MSIDSLFSPLRLGAVQVARWLKTRMVVHEIPKMKLLPHLMEDYDI
jgi:hypothetical protein